MSECDYDAPIMRRPWPTRSCCSRKKRKAEDCSCETWFDSREGREISLLSKASRPAVEFVRAPFSGYQDFVRRGKDGLSPSGEEVKNKWRYTATSP